MEFCSEIDRSTLEISVFSKDCISFSRCSYLKSLAYLKYDAIKDIDIFNFNYIDDLCVKSSSLCAVKCNKLSKKIKNVKIGISKKCNFNCYHCFNDKHEDFIEDKEIYFYLLNAAKGHNFDALILGHQGEVFTYYDEIKNYIMTLTDNDFKRVIFQTNLSLLNEDRINELKYISDQKNIEFIFFPTVNGITEESFKNITKTDCFNTVIENLKLLLNTFGPSRVRVTFTIKEPNVNDLPNVSSFFKELGVERLNVNYDMFSSKCKDLYLSFLNNGHLRCIYENATFEPTIKSKGLKRYVKSEETKLFLKEQTLNKWKELNHDELISEVIINNMKNKQEKILMSDKYDDILTIGITVHKEQIISDSLMSLITSCKKIKFLISNDAGENFNKDIKDLFKDNQNVKFIYAKPGIENNRQNILDNTESKYIYVVDYDDELKINEQKLLTLLEELKDEVIFVNPYEMGTHPCYLYYSDIMFFITTWAQIFSVDFLRQVGGYIQTWNFVHEEFGTNANILANIYSRNIVYNIHDLADDDILYYNHLLSGNEHNSMLEMQVRDIISFITKIPKNDSILYKKMFLSIFKERLPVMKLSDRHYKKVMKAIKSVSRRVL